MWRFIGTLLEQMVGSDCSVSQQKARKGKATPFGVTFIEKPSSRKQSLMELQDSTDHMLHNAVKGWAGPEVVRCL